VGPLYTIRNCTAAYQLNWSLAVFGKVDLPPVDEWLAPLQEATEPDGVRILEARLTQPNVAQFLVSSTPVASPSEIVRSVKGRWQYLLRSRQPAAFRRNYRITAVGEANCRVLDRYVGGQTDRHTMADARVQQRLQALQFEDPVINLAEIETGTYGQFLHSLQVVIENADGWNEIRPDVLTASRDMIIRAAAAKKWRLRRIGLLANHIHILLGASVTESPAETAVALMNNLAYVQKMRPVFRHSFYVGTFGEYDRGAIRQNL
jgi:REP element-mobilizing transposase RayT